MKRQLVFCLLTPLAILFIPLPILAGISIPFGKKGEAYKNCDISAPASHKNAFGKAFPEK